MNNKDETEQPDWTREHKAWFEWNPSRSLLSSIRTYQKYVGRKSAYASAVKKISVIKHRFWSIVTGADIPLNCKIGGGLLLPHPNGVVIHPDSEIGTNCLIFQQVTIGMAKGGVPKIGTHVDIGAGAKIIGPITVGNHALIGANAVVVLSVPSRYVATGIPAKNRPQ